MRDTALLNQDRLLKHAQEMDSQALSQIHDQFYPAVYRYVRYRLENEQIVEDISADVFLRLLNHLHHRKGEIHDLRAWLLGTAANLVNDHLRHKYRRPTEDLEDYESLPSDESLHQSAEESEEHAAVRQAMQRLTPEQQHVLSLRFSQGFSVDETARIMQKTVGAVKVLQFRALNTLKRLLTGEKKA